ncbi:hypothetical protein, partial [Vibrio cholerae]|uniref:hypothetical protein n=1 Tax=Vibrio cholerae TaxID=666 RepID=UPI001C8E6E4A
GVSSPNEPQWLRLLCLSLVVVRCQPLRRALCLITKNQLVASFLAPRLVGFVFVGKLASSGAAFWTSILWRWKFRELPQSIFE